jgi:hypothetical protein
MKTKLFDTTSLTEFLPRNVCFAEQDADDAPAGGGGDAVDADGEAEEEAPEFLFEEDDAAQSEEGDDDHDELEIGPEKYKVPKPVKEAWNGVQKTTQAEREAIANEKKEVEARRTRYEENMRLAATYVKEIGRIQAIDEQIADYDKLTPQDWMTWALKDRDGASQAQIGYNALLQERKKLMDGIQEKEATIKSQREREQADLIAKSEREIAAKIKDWSPQKKEALLKVGGEFGFSSQELAGVSHDPRVMAMLDELAVARAAKARARKVAEEAKAAKLAAGGAPEPIARARGNTGSSNSLGDSVSMDTWAKNFSKRRAKRT